MSPTRNGHPTRNDGSVWCEQHERWECTRNVKQSRGGRRCHGRAITGLDRCRMHAGERADIARAKGEAVTAWSALAGKPTVTTTEAVLGMLQMSWLRVHLYAGLLEEQVTKAQENRDAAGGREAHFGDDDDEAPARMGAPSVGPGAGLVGHTFSGVKDIGIFASGEAIRGLAQLEAAERDRCVRYAKTAHDMGIAEREIQLAEGQGQLLAAAVRRIADGLLAAALAALGALDDPVAARVSVDVVRSAWPGWVRDIAPRELRAAVGGANTA